MKNTKLIRAFVAVFMSFFTILSLGTRIAAQAEDLSLTIVKLSQLTEDHELTTPPSTQLEPLAGGVYQLWEIDDFDHTTDDYNQHLDTLNALSLAQLDQDYPSGGQVSEPTNAQGTTTLTGLTESAYYVREVTESVDSQSLPFLIVLPLVDEAGNILSNTTVYPKTELKKGQVQLTKYGLPHNESPRDDAVPLEGIEFHFFSGSDEEGLYPLGFDEAGNYDPNLAGTSLVTDQAGQITLGNLVAGSYYFKEIKTYSPYELNDEPLYVEVLAGELVRVDMDNYGTEEGGYRFKKVASDKEKEALPGAEFKVTQLVDGEYVDVTDESGAVIALISDENGLFEVNNLPIGDYYLVETKAPVVGDTTYELLKTSIKFTVTSTSYDTEIMEIVNDPETPAPPIIPGTGDWRFYALLVIVAAIFVIGLRLYRQEGQPD